MFRSLGAALSLATLVHTVPATASAIVIWPIDPVIKAGEQATALWLENKGTMPVTMQVRAFAWSQADGSDTLSAQDVIVASPPIARVEPGKRQLVRIIRRTPGTAAEGTFRLLIDELPPPPPEGTAAPVAKLAVQMRYSVPLFTYATAETGTPRLSVRVSAGPEGRELRVTNTGTRHARLTDLRVVTGSHQTMVRAGLAGYVLAGATIAFPLPTTGGTVRVAVNGVDQTLVPDA